jgi:hypothetical protein
MCGSPALINALFLLSPVTNHIYIPRLPSCFPVCRACTLDPDSLEPLAQLASLRELVVYACGGITLAALEGLMSTAVQGCWLTVRVGHSQDVSIAES